MATITADILTLSQAAEVRDADGNRRYGSIDTLRRRIKSGSLRHKMHGGKYVVALTDLEAMRKASAAERAFDELKAAAKRSAAAAPPISAERRDLIIAILRGAAR